MKRPTKKRLEEIRKCVGFDVSDYDMVGDLFAEIDFLTNQLGVSSKETLAWKDVCIEQLQGLAGAVDATILEICEQRDALKEEFTKAWNVAETATKAWSDASTRADNLQAKNTKMVEVLKIMADIDLCKGCTRYNEEVLTKFGEWEKVWEKK